MPTVSPQKKTCAQKDSESPTLEPQKVDFSSSVLSPRDIRTPFFPKGPPALKGQRLNVFVNIQRANVPRQVLISTSLVYSHLSTRVPWSWSRKMGNFLCIAISFYWSRWPSKMNVYLPQMCLWHFSLKRPYENSTEENRIPASWASCVTSFRFRTVHSKDLPNKMSLHDSLTFSGWWFQPIWKILVKLEIFPK